MGTLPTSDPDVILEFHQKLISKLMEYEEVISSLTGGTVHVGIVLEEPELQMRLIINGAETRLERVEPADNSEDDPKIIMKWATALKFWLGEIDLMSALFTGAVKIQGQNMDPLFKLKSIVSHAKTASQEVVKEMGWE